MDRFFEKNYSIQVSKLKNGLSTEHFEIHDEFFGHFEYSPIEHGKLGVDATIMKYETHLDISFDIKGEITLECDRCMDPYPHQLATKDRVIYAYDERLEYQTDDVVQIAPNQHLIPIHQELYDFILLQVPIRKVPDMSLHKCNPEVLKYISGESDLDQEDSEEEENSQIDPRWESLKKFTDND